MARRSDPLLGIVVGAVAVSACSSPTGPDSGNGGSNPTLAITCPAAPSTQLSPNGGPTPVAYGTPIVSGGQAPVAAPSCLPASGTSFPVGTTPVTCSVVDAGQRTASCTFNIVVARAPQISLTKFVAFGDSITWGENGEYPGTCTGITTQSVPRRSLSDWRPYQRLDSALRYTTILQQELRDRYIGQLPTVTNSGCPGEMAGDICRDTGELAVNRFKALMTLGFEAVLLMEGTNDVNPDPTRTQAGLDGLQQMITAAKASRVRPFVGTIPPQVAGRFYTSSPTFDPRRATEFNARVRSLAVLNSVTLVDVEAAFGASAPQLIGCDGIHPNAMGQQTIAETFFNILRASLEVPATTTITAPASMPFVVHPQAAPLSTIRPGGRQG